MLKGLLATAVAGLLGAAGTGTVIASNGRSGDDKGGDGKDNGNHGQGKKTKPDCFCCPDSAPTACDVQCVDTTSDPSNCGDCGVTCPAGATCQDGSCVCPSGTTHCGDACVDTSSDRANCGACGAACSPDQTCVAGSCQTPNCDDGNVCTDDSFDPATGTCVHAPVESGSRSCGANDTCYTPDFQNQCVCDGSGGCFCYQTRCAPYFCVGNACRTSCDTNLDCSQATGAYYCREDHVCVPKGGSGTTCSTNDQCANGICMTDGTCA